MSFAQKCPECEYSLLERHVHCPYCGAQLTHPTWKKIGAWVLLILVLYVFVKCNLQIMKGLDKF